MAQSRLGRVFLCHKKPQDSRNDGKDRKMKGRNRIKLLAFMVVTATLVCGVNESFRDRPPGGWMAGALLESVVFAIVHGSYTVLYKAAGVG